MKLLPPRTGEVIGDSTGRRVEILCDDDALHATWSRFGPGRDGADLHIHQRHSDLFYVLEGELTLALGASGGSAVAPAGTLVYVPPLVVHGFRNAGAVDVRYLNFHAPGSGFADYLRARRDGLPSSVDQGSFDSEDPPADGGRSPEAASIGRGELDSEEIGVSEIRLESGSTRSAGPSAPRRGLTCVYVLEGVLVLTAEGREQQAEAGAWVQLASGAPPSLASAGSGSVRFLQIQA